MGSGLVYRWLRRRYRRSGRTDCPTCRCAEGERHRAWRCPLAWADWVSWRMNGTRAICPYCGSRHMLRPERYETEECWLLQRPIGGLELL